jgi:fructokinase
MKPVSPTSSPVDVLAAGELLVDLISDNFADSLDDVHIFKRMPGGSPANLAGNLARLGKRTALAATVGHDALGTFLADFVASLGLDLRCLRRTNKATSLILVTRSREVSSFSPYRRADRFILAEQFPEEVLLTLKLFHTTCFALSREPARGNIMRAAERVADHGGQLSIDANYAAEIWPDQGEAQRVVAHYCSLGALVKFSEVDWGRLYGYPLVEPATAAEYLLRLGARAACITLGDKGCFVSNGTESHFLPSRPVQVSDTTGAGDAFWSGFLSAWLDGHSLAHCAMAGRKMAEKKLEHYGPLPARIPARDIYVDFT